jgi:hypothetical protein
MRIIVAIAIFSQWSGETQLRPKKGVLLIRSLQGMASCVILSSLASQAYSSGYKVSYYINLVLEGVGISDTKTKGQRESN